MKNRKQNIVLIGAGNLASHLALALRDAGYEIDQVFSRTEKSAKSLATRIGSTYTIHVNAIKNDADIYIFAIKDSVLPDFLKTLNVKNKFFVHTAGSVSMDVFKAYTQRYGVFYPMQTFSKSKALVFKEIPVFIEANNTRDLALLRAIGTDLSSRVKELNSEKRELLHVAAVFTSNFTNHMYVLAAELLQRAQLDFDLMLPLIKESASKIESLSPKEAQTGPAVRYDQSIIDSHLQILKNEPETQQLYKLISENIHRLNN